MPEIAPLRAGDPRSLGPYRLLGLLGEGGQGSVYLGEEVSEDDEAPEVGTPEDEAADDQNTGDQDDASGEGAQDGAGEGRRRVAVKLLHARLTGDARARARFAAELKVARRVAAFCTARILDADVEGDRPYIVSEYIDGPALSDVLSAEGPRSGADLDRLAIGTMTALAAIHQAGVVHRDLKPANVLLATDGPRVIDFGIARALDATGTLSSTAVGTPAYMAPEQISGGPIGPRTDIWAWGATMVYAATGRAAFGQDSIPTVMHRILNLPPDLGSLTEPLRGLVQACLNKQAAYRPSSQQVLTHLLHLAGSLPRVPDGGPGTQTPEAQSAAMLNQGAEVAATHTGIHLVVPSAQAPQFPAPPPAPGPPPQGFPPAPAPGSYPQDSWTPAPPQQHGYAPQQQWGQPSTWPGPSPGTGGDGTQASPPRGRGKLGMGVLASAGSAALAALIVIAAVIVTQLGDDGTPGGRTTGRTGGQLRMSLSTISTETALSPSSALFGTERIVAKHVFTGLVDMGPDGKVRNRLATRITPNADCTSWKIDLRAGTTFGNGEQVTAEAFARGWSRTAADPDSLAPTLIGDVRGFAEVRNGRSDDLSGLRVSGLGLQVDLDGPDCEFPQRLADPSLAPVPTSAGRYDNAAYNRQPIGNGPFKVVSHNSGQNIVLARNSGWAFGSARLDRVAIDLTTETTAAGRERFEAGQSDWVTLDSETLPSVRGNRLLVKRTLPGLHYLIPLTRRGTMSKRPARIAVAQALDRQAISDTVYGGVYPPATSIVPSSLNGRQVPVCLPCRRPDAAQARQGALAAGFPPGHRITLYARTTPSYQRRLAEVVRDQLQRALGWQVEIKYSPDLSAYMKQIAADDAEGLALFAWQADYPSSRNILEPLLGGDQVATPTNGLTNYSKWRNTQFDQLLDEAARTADATGRNGRLIQAESVALGDMAIIPVVYLTNGALRSDKFTGLEMDPEGHPTLTTAAYK